MSIFANSWYTDSADVYRDVQYTSGNLNKQNRIKVLSGVPCRVYQSSNRTVKFSETDSTVTALDFLACDNSFDIRTGDEILVGRGKRIGYNVPVERYFAGNAQSYFEPYGNASPQLNHKEIPLSKDERVRDGV